MTQVPEPTTTGAKVTYAAVVASAAVVAFGVIWVLVEGLVWSLAGAAVAAIAMRIVLGMIGIPSPFGRPGR